MLLLKDALLVYCYRRTVNHPSGTELKPRADILAATVSIAVAATVSTTGSMSILWEILDRVLAVARSVNHRVDAPESEYLHKGRSERRIKPGLRTAMEVRLSSKT
jgi:hypothetical protein